MPTAYGPDSMFIENIVKHSDFVKEDTRFDYDSFASNIKVNINKFR